MNLKAKGTPYHNYTQVPNFTPFCTTASFQVTCRFETSAPNDHKITLNTTRSKLPHISITTTPNLSLSFTLQLSIIELHAIMRHVYQITPNDLTSMKTKSSKVSHMHITTTHESQISFHPAVFKLRPF